MTPASILIATPYFHPRIGGLEHYAQQTAQGLNAQGWRVIVVCGDTAVRGVKREVTADGLIIYRLPIWKVVSNTPIHFRWYFMLRRIIQTEKPAIINAHTPVPFMVDMAALAAGRRPFVITYHAATLRKPGSRLMNALTEGYLGVQRLTLRRAGRIIAVSPDVKAALGPRYAHKTRVVPNAVARVSQPRRSPGNGLVFIANLEPSHSWKGLQLILAALAKIKAHTGSAPKLTVIGDGGARPGYEQQAAALSLANTVTFAGRKTGRERDQLIRAAGALVAYPTTANDAFPTVFLEAWAEGLPVVAAAIGPLKTLIKPGQTGLLVPPNDPDALARAITGLFKDPEAMTKMGEAGRRLVAEQYTAATQTQRTIEVLEQLL